MEDPHGELVTPIMVSPWNDDSASKRQQILQKIIDRRTNAWMGDMMLSNVMDGLINAARTQESVQDENLPTTKTFAPKPKMVMSANDFANVVRFPAPTSSQGVSGRQPSDFARCFVDALSEKRCPSEHEPQPIPPPTITAEPPRSEIDGAMVAKIVSEVVTQVLSALGKGR